eukprot:scaffold8556_cov286-Pinguiococcus_pyrenoidosus.AAC.1
MKENRRRKTVVQAEEARLRNAVETIARRHEHLYVVQLRKHVYGSDHDVHSHVLLEIQPTRTGLQTLRSSQAVFST